MQRRLQPLVTSQKISRGVYSFLPAGCVLPLPCVIVVFSPPHWVTPFFRALLAKEWKPTSARLCYLNDRILMTQGAVSGITRACDVCHSGVASTWRTPRTADTSTPAAKKRPPQLGMTIQW